MALTKVQTIGIETGISLTGVTSAVNLNVTGITTVGVVSATSLNVSGVITATNFVGSGSQLTGVASTDNIRTNTNATFLQNINVTGIVTAAGVNASGVITATSFSGSGANLTGLAATANVTTSSLVVIGVTTVSAGSTAAPSITPTGDSNTGIFFPSVDTIAFSEGGSEAARIDSSGRFGIGTPAPDSRFVIRSHSGVIDTPIFKIEHPSNDADFAISGLYDTDGNVTYLGSNLYLNSSYVPARFDTGKPSSAITLSGRTGNGEITFLTGTATASERARIDPSGRLLVGTSSTSRSASLQIVQANQTVTSGQSNVGIFTSNTQAADIGGMLALGGQSGEANWLYGSVSGRSENNSYGGYLQFGVSTEAGAHTEAARINRAGELLIGYTSDNGAFKLQVNSQIFATSSTISTSDGRYKENVATLDGCVDLVKALRPVSFYWKPQQNITRIDEDGNEVLVREGHNFPEGAQVGFIAQEVQTVLAEKPWLTSVIKQNVRPAVTDNDGNELASEEEFLGIAEGNLIAVLTSALQEAIGEIEALKARLDAANL